MQLKQNIPTKFIKRQKYIKLEGGLNRHNLCNNILRRIFALVNSFISAADRYYYYEQFKATVIGKNHTKHGYTGKYDDVLAAIRYAEEIGAIDFGEARPTESYRLYQEQIRTLRDLILVEKTKEDI